MELGAAFVAMLEIFMSPTQLPFKHFNLVLTIDIGLQFFLVWPKRVLRFPCEFQSNCEFKVLVKAALPLGDEHEIKTNIYGKDELQGLLL